MSEIIYCKNCNSSDLTEISDGEYECQECDNVFTKDANVSNGGKK